MADRSNSAPNAPCQLLDALKVEEYAALREDIAKRGVLVPVEIDENGAILDGHHRVAIADELGVEYETVVRHFASEQEKREHVLKINIARRQMDPVQWGTAFRSLLALREVRVGRGARNDAGTSATVAEVARELGVAERTARHRLAQAAAFEALPDDSKVSVAAGEKTLSRVRREAKEHDRQTRRDANAALVASAPSPEEALGVAKFATIVIDPPWDPGDEGDDKGEGLFGRGRPVYATMTIAELVAMSVGTFADADSHIYLWITNRSLFRGTAPTGRPCVVQTWCCYRITTTPGSVMFKELPRSLANSTRRLESRWSSCLFFRRVVI